MLRQQTGILFHVMPRTGWNVVRFFGKHATVHVVFIRHHNISSVEISHLLLCYGHDEAA